MYLMTSSDVNEFDSTLFYETQHQFPVQKDFTISTESKQLPHIMPVISFYSPWRHQKTSGFEMFSGGIERDQWHEMGWKTFRILIFSIFPIFCDQI